MLTSVQQYIWINQHQQLTFRLGDLSVTLILTHYMDPLSLPSTLLSDPEHLDHLLYQLQTDFSNIDTKFQQISIPTNN